MNEKELEKILKALASRRRLAILSIIKKENKLPVGAIADKIKLSFKSTSKHLLILSSVDMVEKDQKNTQVFYAISPGINETVRKIILLL